ncbi:MAG: hypothetical protein E6R03_13590 [Hyphomicrobiaceae bacterium]|nr:MAG: hypothetical protein E6R03_13590 [Hyphomicrobiaceae bacterium]
MKYTVEDTFNKRTVSNHRTLLAAVRAERKFLKAVKRANGANSYIPTRILVDGVRVDDEALTDARIQADSSNS